MCDDTCYFIPFQSGSQAILTASILNHSLAQEFIESVLFTDEKRPITKKLLSRIDLAALLRFIPLQDLEARVSEMAAGLGLPVVQPVDRLIEETLGVQTAARQLSLF